MKRKKKILKRGEKGITLIALVITIIVLLILAGVSIAMLTGENGILIQAQRAKNETENAQAQEENILDSYEQYININTGITLQSITGYETTNTIAQDSLGNKVVVPAGFKVINPEASVEDGLVIEDVNHEDTKGSQFVWIPVGTIHTESKGDITISLDRYAFGEDGKELSKANNQIEELNGKPCQELSSSSYGNITAKENIESGKEGFRKSAISNGGYYIGRYEARDGVVTSARTDSTEPTHQVVTKLDNFVYNYITQSQAANLSRNMYKKNSNFTSDLVNSYAWDTAIVFIQKCSGDTDYSRQTRVIDDSFSAKGTTNDVVCNIFDMANNCWEFTTETCNSSDNPCVIRGGWYGGEDKEGYCVSSRDDVDISLSSNDGTFRPILYLY